MISRLPRAAGARSSATLPPAGLDGLDPVWSRLVAVNDPDDATARTRTWHLLDNADELAALGAQPVGTILCVHGNPTWSYLWRRLLRAATDAAESGQPAFRVIAVDQLEMGFSERSGFPRPLARRVADLGALTDTLGLHGPVWSLGHDWGGVVSLGWAVDHPELLAGVMLLNTAVHQPVGSAIPAPLRLTLGLLGAATVTTPAFLETTLALAHPPLSPAVKSAFRAPYDSAARRAGIGGFVADIPVDAGHQSSQELDRIAAGVAALRVPALMLWGPRDPIFSDRYLDDLVDRLPHADVHRFEGAGHLIAEDVDYAGAVLAWLGERTSPGAPTESSEPAGARGPELDPHITKAPDPTAAASLWKYLDGLRDSDETALIEMAPRGGSAPRIVSWRVLARRVDELAAGFARIGVKRGHRVSLLVPPGADLTAVLYACLRIGAVVVVADAGLGLRGLTRAVRGAWCDHVIGALPGLTAARALGWPGQKISVDRLPRAAAAALGVAYSLRTVIDIGSGGSLPAQPGADDIAAILFTSGSTGPAKGVVYSHGQLASLCTALATQYGIGPGTGLVAGFAPFALLGPALGTRSVTPDMDVTSPKSLTATAVAAAVAAVDATVVFLSPAAIANVVATASSLADTDRAALGGVRDFLSAGAPVSEPLLTAASALMPNAVAHTPYGMTEGLLMTDVTLQGIRSAAAAAAAEDAMQAQAAQTRSDSPVTDGLPSDPDAVSGVARGGGVCVGVPAAGARVLLSALDADGRATGDLSDVPGVTGEIVVTAPHLKTGYDRLWLTDRAARHGVPSRRWHRTGDVGHFDAAGRLFVEGRLPHLVVTADGVLTPVAPELRIEGVTGVARAAIVGVGPRGTEQIVAIVEAVPPARRVHLAPPTLAAEIRAAAAVPLCAVLVVPSLPTDVRHNSKIDRTRLAHWAAAILAGGRMSRP